MKKYLVPSIVVVAVSLSLGTVLVRSGQIARQTRLSTPSPDNKPTPSPSPESSSAPVAAAPEPSPSPTASPTPKKTTPKAAATHITNNGADVQTNTQVSGNASSNTDVSITVNGETTNYNEHVASVASPETSRTNLSNVSTTKLYTTVDETSCGSDFTISRNTAVTLTIGNEGSSDLSYGVDGLVGAQTIAQGREATFSFTPTRSGRYTIRCGSQTGTLTIR